MINMISLRDCDSKGYEGLRGNGVGEHHALFSSIQHYWKLLKMFMNAI